jgi:nucleotide-binding universal stress UspA family protein
MELRTILFPTDYSESSRTALPIAIDLARDYGARLLILHIVDTLGPENATFGEATDLPQPESYRRRLWADFKQSLPTELPDATELLLGEGEPSTAILNAAAERACDLIVLGSHGKTGLRRLLGGSVAEDVIRLASCPVLVVKVPRPASHPSGQATELHPRFLSESSTSEPTSESTAGGKRAADRAAPG